MITLPDWPAPASASPFLIDFGGTLSPALGGQEQRINRLGSRFGIAVTMPPMPSAKLGRQWLASLILGKSEGVRIELPMAGFDPGLPGAVLVDGAGQAGTTLNVRAATPNYAFRFGQFFSIVTGGRHHLHMVAAETLADSAGEAALPIAPMLRTPPADGDACHFAQPMIEGFISGSELAWQWSIGNFVGLEFEIRESR